ncbi:uncharacterized protein A4U43_C05F12620 [Asparagus officinalis]|uniref:Ubiquitin-like domain-containing protein n=1 Tax=Asparagus officinalis TaxID=4686 RepID=A0A5P1ES76_ASPOF|nr:uncharacterized protein A4U43_C05F12620 [Asparagus officinalis]
MVSVDASFLRLRTDRERWCSTPAFRHCEVFDRADWETSPAFPSAPPTNRIIYCGRQLELDSTLALCSVETTLRSTSPPGSESTRFPVAWAPGAGPRQTPLLCSVNTRLPAISLTSTRCHRTSLPRPHRA